MAVRVPGEVELQEHFAPTEVSHTGRLTERAQVSHENKPQPGGSGALAFV